jgi:hypothetical protein
MGTEHLVRPTTSDTALPDGAIVELYAWDDGAGALIVAAMGRAN